MDKSIAGREDSSLEDLRHAIGVFIRERDWEQFHSPKNLAMALSVEASEIVEHFQWLTEVQSKNLPPEKLFGAGRFETRHSRSRASLLPRGSSSPTSISGTRRPRSP